MIVVFTRKWNKNRNMKKEPERKKTKWSSNQLLFICIQPVYNIDHVCYNLF